MQERLIGIEYILGRQMKEYVTSINSVRLTCNSIKKTAVVGRIDRGGAEERNVKNATLWEKERKTKEKLKLKRSKT